MPYLIMDKIGDSWCEIASAPTEDEARASALPGQRIELQEGTRSEVIVSGEPAPETP